MHHNKKQIGGLHMSVDKDTTNKVDSESLGEMFIRALHDICNSHYLRSLSGLKRVMQYLFVEDEIQNKTYFEFIKYFDELYTIPIQETGDNSFILLYQEQEDIYYPMDAVAWIIDLLKNDVKFGQKLCIHSVNDIVAYLNQFKLHNMHYLYTWDDLKKDNLIGKKIGCRYYFLSPNQSGTYSLKSLLMEGNKLVKEDEQIHIDNLSSYMEIAKSRGVIYLKYEEVDEQYLQFDVSDRSFEIMDNRQLLGINSEDYPVFIQDDVIWFETSDECKALVEHQEYVSRYTLKNTYLLVEPTDNTAAFLLPYQVNWDGKVSFANDKEMASCLWEEITNTIYTRGIAELNLLGEWLFYYKVILKPIAPFTIENINRRRKALSERGYISKENDKLLKELLDALLKGGYTIYEDISISLYRMWEYVGRMLPEFRSTNLFGGGLVYLICNLVDSTKEFRNLLIYEPEKLFESYIYKDKEAAERDDQNFIDIMKMLAAAEKEETLLNEEYQHKHATQMEDLESIAYKLKLAEDILPFD